MLRLTENRILLLNRYNNKMASFSKRTISKYLDKDISGKVVRQRFIDYFKNEHNHNFVRSSPVMPFCDPTVAFVNAGMNQFKGIFLGEDTIQHKRVVNSQKCVRVGGKHNDLCVVGTDGFHHTFFEMLGNWSFGDYFKKEACEMAWTLLTKVYKIHPARLYVTYFGGDQEMGLKPDEECKEIWKSIGVHESNILPFGPSDNFWEMGPTGPCGPCTEIHIDHLGRAIRPEYVNKGLYDLTELWNLVFIQFNRDSNGKLTPLPKKHIDTGMGFERLVAVLQSKISNYDTDVFEPIFKGIQKICKNAPPYQGKFGENDWNEMDASYRILADHARMITACLADGMIPEANQKLRRVMRRFFTISETKFQKNNGLLKETSNYVIESLGCTYPEMEKMVKQTQAIINYEEEVFKEVRKSSLTNLDKLIAKNPLLATLPSIDMPGLVPALKELNLNHNNGVKKLTTELSFKFYDTYGLDLDTIKDLCQCLHLEFDETGFKTSLNDAKLRSKASVVNEVVNLNSNSDMKAKTDDCYKYAYFKKQEQEEYEFPDVKTKIIDVIDNNDVNGIITDKTNFYVESGGQSSDKGLIMAKDCVLTINNVVKYGPTAILHFVKKQKEQNLPLTSLIKKGDEITLKIDTKSRLANMRNHTSVHLLNAVVKSKLKNTVTCQKGSKVTPEGLTLELGIFGQKLDDKIIEEIELQIRQIIQNDVKVDVQVLNNSQDLLKIDGLTTIPGEVYPTSDIRLVKINDPKIDLISREPCCGTHVKSTKDIGDFTIINVKSLGRSTVSIFAVTGNKAKLAQENGRQLEEDLFKLKKDVGDNISDSTELWEMALQAMKQRLKFDVDVESSTIPFVVKSRCFESLRVLEKTLKDVQKSQLKEFIDLEMKNTLETNIRLSKKSKTRFLVHYLRTSMILESVSLSKATRLCPDDLPVLVVAFTDNTVKARCCVPKNVVNGEFNAQTWIGEVSKVFRSNSAAPKGQDPSLICNMKAKKVNLQDFDALLSEGIENAINFAQNKL